MERFSLEDISTDELARFCSANTPFYEFGADLLASEIYGDPWMCADDVVATRGRDGKLSGILIGVLRPWTQPLCMTIQLFVVDQKEHGTGLASALYEDFELRLAERGIKRVEMLGGGTYYVMPGLDPRHERAYGFLAARGFTRGEEDRVDMVCDLEGRAFDTAEPENRMAGRGIEIRRAGDSDRESLKTFNRREFSEGWSEEVDRAFLNQPVSVYVAVDGDESVLGYAAYCAGYRRFGPMGTRRDMRGFGIGRACLYKALQGMHTEFGLVRALIPWVGPTQFYGRACNATVDRTYWVMTKDL
jgi:mycothiol synthase